VLMIAPLVYDDEVFILLIFKPDRRFGSHLDSQGRFTSAHDNSLQLTPSRPGQTIT